MGEPGWTTFRAGISSATGSTTAAARFPAPAPLHRRLITASANRCYSGTSAKAITAMSSSTISALCGLPGQHNLFIAGLQTFRPEITHITGLAELSVGHADRQVEKLGIDY